MPADQYTEQKLRERGYHIGDIVSADLRKPRNPKFHRLAHQIGTLCAENIESFSGMDAHACIKRLQLEAGIGCDEYKYKLSGVKGMVIQSIPRSLSFESMSEDEFRPLVRRLCEHIAREYWPDLDADQIERMAKSMVD